MVLAYSYIRFSTPQQAAGDSLRRQLEGTVAYCKDRGYVLSESTMRDLGVSAFRGRNAKEGALAAFLAAVVAEKIQAGSVLIVEDIDRLSRQEPLESLDLIREIVKHNVKLVTLIDRQEYTRQSLRDNPGQLFILLGKCIRAHEESSTKSKRVAAAWNEKRAKAAEKPLTGKCPGWITLRNGRYEFNSHEATMRRVLQMALDGHGAPTIAQRLNREHVPVMTQKTTVKLWHYSVIQHVVRSRALIGEYQPCRMVDGKATPTGEPMVNYYPPLLDEPMYYRVQAALAVRAKVKRQGRTGKNVANIFGRVLKDGRDGSTMILSQKHKQNLNMVSMNAANGISPFNSFPYQPFEAAFLTWVKEVTLLPTKESHATAVEGKIAVLRRKIDLLTAAMDSEEDDFARMVSKLKGYEQQERELVGQLHFQRAEEHGTKADGQDIGLLAEEMNRMVPGDELTGLRTRLKVAIAAVVREIRVYIHSHKMMRLAIAHVTLANGTSRLFAVRTERYQPPTTYTDHVHYSAKFVADHSYWAYTLDSLARLMLIAQSIDGMREVWQQWSVGSYSAALSPQARATTPSALSERSGPP